MTRSGALWVSVRKETRALFVVWAACAMALGLSGGLGDPSRYRAGLLAYGFGAIALGAQSIGHEYTHGTLGLLLLQPVNRQRLFLIKLSVLAAMLLTLAAVAWIIPFYDQAFLPASIQDGPAVTIDRDWVGMPVLVLASLCGLCLAPYLTMLCRSPLAGVVFTVPVAGHLWILGWVVGVAWYGLNQDAEIEQFSLVFFWRGMFVACAVAAIAGWRRFMRLETMEGPDPAVHLPRWLTGDTTRVDAAPVAEARPRHPTWLLAKKELRLQQMTLVVAGLYVVIIAVASSLSRRVPELPGTVAAIWGVYGALLALLIGSLASAEERQLRTLEWQVFLPMAAWKQWAIKVGTALGLATLLSFGFSIFFAAGPITFNAWYATVIILLTTGSLYVSSLCSGALRALVLSGSVLVAVVLVQAAIARLLESLFEQAPPGLGWLPAVLLAGFVVPALRFAFQNHRSAERGALRVVRQIVWIAGCLTIGIALWAAVTMVN